MNEIIINSDNFIPLTWFVSFLGLGALMIWYQGTKSYDRGMTEAILLHREGRLTYSDYVDERGVTMVDIQIEPKDD